MKVKINSCTTFLFSLKSEAIAYALTSDVDYKPYNVFETSRTLSECNEDDDDDDELYIADHETFDV